jgi:hypothetical protein
MHKKNAVIGNGAAAVPCQLNKNPRRAEAIKLSTPEANTVNEELECPPVHVFVVKKLKAKRPPTLMAVAVIAGMYDRKRRLQSVWHGPVSDN